MNSLTLLACGGFDPTEMLRMIAPVANAVLSFAAGMFCLRMGHVKMGIALMSFSAVCGVIGGTLLFG
jgi:hypothetical protein